jgi:protein-S-isoprenylcysteine O-methyltransferase Ste14
MSEPDWDAVRRRLRNEASAQAAIILSPVLLVLAVVTVIQQPAGPHGDTKDAPGYWIALAILFTVIAIGLFVVGVRVLRTGRPDGSGHRGR